MVGRNLSTKYDGKKLADRLVRKSMAMIKAMDEYSMRPGLALLTSNLPDHAWEAVSELHDLCKSCGAIFQWTNIPVSCAKRDLIPALKEASMEPEIQGMIMAVGENEEIGIDQDLLLRAVSAIPMDHDVICQRPESLGRFFYDDDVVDPPTLSAFTDVLGDCGFDTLTGLRVVVVGHTSFGIAVNRVMFSSVTSISEECCDPESLKELCQSADVLVVCADGDEYPALVTAEMIQPEAVVVEVRNMLMPSAASAIADDVADADCTLVTWEEGLKPVAMAWTMANLIMLTLHYGKKPHYVPFTDSQIQEILNAEMPEEEEPDVQPAPEEDSEDH